MSEELEQLLSRLSQDSSLFQSVEEAVRQGVILPVLAQLGWNTYNVREVIPEYRVGSGRVDYCLKIAEGKAVFLEVKRLMADLENHEKQLLEYSFSVGVDVAVLTNGLLWWFYLPLGKGDWEQRKFFTIDIKEQDPYVAARHFRDFLSRESIESGLALSRARSLKESREKTQLINQTIPKVWEQIIGEPDELFLELFAEKVESLCGHKPELQILANFVRDVFNNQTRASVMAPPRLQVRGKPEKMGVPTTAASSRIPRQRGITVIIDGREFRCKSVGDLYGKVLKFLYEGKHLDKLKPYLPYATSRKRFLISTTPLHPQGNRFMAPVEYKGYYMESHKSYQNAVKSLTDLLHLVDLSLEQ